MVVHADLAAQHDEIAEPRRTGNTDLTDDDTMAADLHVVGDLHEIVDLRALTDHRVEHMAAVDRGIGADLHIVLDDDAADLRNLGMLLPAELEPEPVLPTRTPAWRMTRLPSSAWVSDTCGPMAQSRPIRTLGPTTAPAASTVPEPISACGPTTTPGSTMTPASRRAVGWIIAPGEIPVAPNSDWGLSACG